MVEEESGSEVFWQFLCSYQQIWWLLAIFTGMFAVLLAFSFVFLESEASYFVMLLDVGIITVVLAGLLYVLRRCQRRQREF